MLKCYVIICKYNFSVILKALSMLFILLTFPVTIWFCVRMVQEYQRAVIFRYTYLFKDFSDNYFEIGLFSNATYLVLKG